MDHSGLELVVHRDSGRLGRCHHRPLLLQIRQHEAWQTRRKTWIQVRYIYLIWRIYWGKLQRKSVTLLITARKRSLQRLCFSVSHSVQGGIPACIAGGIPACIAGGIPACLAGLQGTGIPACLAGLQAHNQGGSWGVWPGGLQGHTWGCLQAHTWDCLQAHTWGVSRPDTPQQMATAVGSMHPTGMHSCLFYFSLKMNNRFIFGLSFYLYFFTSKFKSNILKI